MDESHCKVAIVPTPELPSPSSGEPLTKKRRHESDLDQHLLRQQLPTPPLSIPTDSPSPSEQETRDLDLQIGSPPLSDGSQHSSPSYCLMESNRFTPTVCANPPQPPLLNVGNKISPPVPIALNR